MVDFSLIANLSRHVLMQPSRHNTAPVFTVYIRVRDRAGHTYVHMMHQVPSPYTVSPEHFGPGTHFSHPLRELAGLLGDRKTRKYEY